MELKMFKHVNKGEKLIFAPGWLKPVDQSFFVAVFWTKLLQQRSSLYYGYASGTESSQVHLLLV